MRKHGWQLPYHPLQVVAVAVFLALAFAFYVFFAPFVGKKFYQYIVMGLYTLLIVCVFGLYIWCAAADPADSGVFKSKKYLKISGKGQAAHGKKSQFDGETASSRCEQNLPTKGDKSIDMDGKSIGASVEDFETESVENASLQCSSWIVGILCFPCAFLCKCMNGGEEYTERHMSEDGMFYCSLCEVEVFKYSKHCRVCDKCVDSFDHHCRWLNNCIGKRNYRKFFTLMVFSLLLLILQWSTGILVLICCFLDRKRFNADIVSKLGSSFSIVPYVIVVVVCIILAMIATLPLAQLFFFHILLIKKGISTYDYIIALREQEQAAIGGGQQSPQMSQVSSFTGLSSASSFNTFHRGAFCTPPRLFVEDQYDVVAPDMASVSSYGKKTAMDDPIKKKNPAVKISPWALARLNAEEVTKAAAEARKKSKILQPVSSRREAAIVAPPVLQDTDNSSFGSSGRQIISRLDNNRKRPSKRIRLPTELPPAQRLVGPTPIINRTPLLQMEARNALRSGFPMMQNSAHLVGCSSPESSLESPDLHPVRVSSSGPEEARKLPGLPSSRSSDGYEASGGEDSDRVSYAAVQEGHVNWSSLLFGSNHDPRAIAKLKAASSSTSFSQANVRKH